jgi:hypothetical protein
MKEFDLVIDRYNNWLLKALADIGDIHVEDVPSPPSLSVPDLPVPSIDLSDVPDYTPPAMHLPTMPAAPSLDDLMTGLDLGDMDDLPDAPSMPVLTLPLPPGMSVIQKPDAPDVDTDIPLPEEPLLVIPEMEELSAITIPDFTFPELPDFDGKPPEFAVTVPDVFINWSEPTYESELLDELLAKVRQMMAGGTGLPPEIEDALFSRARERDSAETRRAVQEAFDTWAARDFSMPPGMLVKQVNVAQEAGRLKAAETNRDILVQAAQWEIENIRFAVTQGIALEQLLENLFLNTVNRLFEIAKFQAESQINVFNAQIALFNAQNAAFATTVEVFKARLEGAVARISAYKTMIDAQLAIGQLNVQRVEVFKAKLEGVKASVDIFKARMDGAKIRADIISSQFDMYQSEVRAYAEEINAEKTKFEAYEAQVRGETAKATMFEASARAYAATIQGLSAKAEIKTKGAQLKMDVARVRLQEFLGRIDAYKAEIAASLNEVNYITQVYQARVEGWKASTGAAVAAADVQARFADMTARTNIAYAEMKMSEYSAKVQKAIQTAQIALEAAKALGAFAAQLASGAMSAAHVSAAIEGRGSASSSDSREVATHTNHNYQY